MGTPNSFAAAISAEKDQDDPDADFGALDASGLSIKRHCFTSKQLAVTLGAIISDCFSYNAAQRSKLEKQLQPYFESVGATNEETLSMMSGQDPWTKDGFQEKYDTVTVPVVLLLSKLAEYTALVLREGYFLTREVRYESLSSWAKAQNHPGRYDARGSDSSITDSHSKAPSRDEKIPTFKVSAFEGDTLSGDVFLTKVRDTFKSAGQAAYLDSRDYCAKSIAWSGAFASRIRESISDSDILGFLATELKNEDNCAVVYERIKGHLSSSDVKTARTFAHWMDFFALKCTNRDEFLSFYSSAKKLLFKLEEADSVAATDDMFLRAYLAKVIEAPELQQQTKKFLLDDQDSYKDILEKVHRDYRAMETGEQMRDNDGKKPVLRRAAAKGSGQKGSEKTISLAHSVTPFPNNYDNKIPFSYYKQIKEWYSHASIPADQRSEKSLKWLKNFKFKHTEKKAFRRDQDSKYKSEAKRFRRSRLSRARSYSSDSDSSYDYRDRRRSRRTKSRHRSRSRSRSPRHRSRSRTPEMESRRSIHRDELEKKSRRTRSILFKK